VRVEAVKGILLEKYCVRICMVALLRCADFRDCGVYFKRMRAVAEFEASKEDFEGFIAAQKLDW